MNFICNVSKSPEDPRDYEYLGSDIDNLPDVLDYRNQLNPVRNQGSQGTCYAQTAACVKEWQEKKDYGYDGYFSPQFFYNCRANKYDEKDNNDYGMYGRDVMRLMKNVGICTEKNYPYGTIEHKDVISERLFAEAKQHLVKGYARVKTIENLKKNLCENGPCLIAFPVYNYDTQFWIKNGEKKGGHAVTVAGYNEEGFIIRNSWGSYWGDKGYTIYKYKDWGAHWEIWTTIDEKSVILKKEDLEKFPHDDKPDNKKNECCIIL